MQLLNVMRGHHFPQQTELLREVVRRHVEPSMQSGRPEAVLLREPLQVILQKGVLVADAFEGPHDGDFEAVRVVDRVAWRVDKAAHFHIWRVTVADDRAHFVVQVPDGLTGDALAENVQVGDQGQFFEHLGSVMDLVSLVNIGLAHINVIQEP